LVFLPRSALDEQLPVDVPVALDRGADVTRIDSLPGLDPADELARAPELTVDLRVDSGLEPSLGEHLLDQPPDLWQRLDRGVLKLWLERLPLGLPLVLVQARLSHPLSLRAEGSRETPLRAEALRARGA
jgi:hypothetical protein